MLKSITSRLFNRAISSGTAKNRLQMVLVQDRSGLSAKEMDLFKKDLLDVISKYFLIEQKHMDVTWERSDSQTALVINTPVTGRLKGAEKRLAAAT